MRSIRNVWKCVCLVMMLGALVLYTDQTIAGQGVACYVSEDSGNDSNEGTAEQPLATLSKALELVADGGTIYVKDDLLVEDASNNDAPLVIDKRVTISGVGENCPVISLRAGGIILGADVTFQNVKIGTAGYLRPGIAANGHQLTLINVGQDTSLRSLQIYGGTFFDAVTSSDYGASIRGTASSINITGGSYDAIYAGSSNGSVALPVSIRVEKGNGLSLGGIYAGSTAKNPNDTSTAGKIPQLDNSVALTGKVDIAVNDNASVNIVDGVSESNDVSLTVSGSGWYSFKIQYVDNLTVSSGTFVPAAGSMFGNVTGNVPSVSLAGSASNKATLDLSECSAESNIIRLTNFSGSEYGILVLNNNHKLNLQGTLSGGPTEFRLSGGMPWGDTTNPGYSGWIEYDTTYITGGSGNGTFTIKNPYPTQTDIAFTGDSSVANGWTTIEVGEMEVPKLEELVVESKTIDYADINSSADGVEVAVTPTYAESELNPYLYYVPLNYQISYSNMEGDVTEYRKQSSALDDSESYYLCNYTVSTETADSDTILMVFEPYEDVIYISKGANDVPVGIYSITITATTSAGDVSSEFTLTIKSEDGQTPVDPKPPHTHQWERAWSNNGTYHWHECNASGCTVIENSEKSGYGAHCGGTSYCNAKPVCTTCGVKYGSVNESNHTGGTEIRNSVAATAIKDGYTGDIYCKGCNAKIATGTVIPATGENSNETTDLVNSNSVTGKERFVALLYENVLERYATSSEIDWWVQELKNGKTGAEVAFGFIFSPEFTNKNFDNSDYVERLYMSMMGRASDEGGKDYWMTHLQNGISRLYIFKQFVNSPEFTNLCQNYGIARGDVMLTEARDQNYNVTRFVARNYREFLEREFEEDGMNYWTYRINQRIQTMQEIAFGFVFSPECMNMNMSNEEFVHMLYRGCFDREGDAFGVRYWVSRLDAGTHSREDVFYGFANSQEFANMVSNYGL